MVHSATPRMQRASFLLVLLIGIPLSVGLFFVGKAIHKKALGITALEARVKALDSDLDTAVDLLRGLNASQHVIAARIAKLEHDSVIPPAIKTNLLIEAGVVSGRFITNHTALIIHPNNQVTVGKTLDWITKPTQFLTNAPTKPQSRVLPPSPSQRQSVTHK